MYNIDSERGTTHKYAGKQQKGENMEGMTNEQFGIVIKMIVQILKDDGVKEETIKKIEALLEK